MKARTVHLWVSITVALPILLVALTALLMAHDRTLKLREIELPAHWLPGLRGEPQPGLEVRAVAEQGDTRWLGTREGLWRQQAGQWLKVDGLERADVRALLPLADGRMLAASRQGLFAVNADGKARRLQRGDFWTLAEHPDGSLLAVARDSQLLASRDGGKSWKAAHADLLEQLSAQVAQQPPRSITVSQLVKDLHTGKALLGGAAEWVWIDVLAGSLSLLIGTGLWMWWRSQRRKAGALERPVAVGVAA